MRARKVSDARVSELLDRYAQSNNDGFANVAALAREFGISRSYAWELIAGRKRVSVERKCPHCGGIL